MTAPDRFAEDDLDTLSAQIHMEAGALRHWTTTPESQPASSPEPQPAARPWPEAPAADAGDGRADLAGDPAVEPGGRAGAARHHPAGAASHLPLAEEAPPREHHLIRPVASQGTGAGLPHGRYGR
ncbi:hypothetical protein SVIOM74S_03793 [Streptomyces violarus]